MSITDGELLEGMLEASGQIAWAVSLEGVVLDVSRSIEGVLGYPPERVVGRRLEDLLPDERVSAARHVLRRLVEGRSAFREIETKLPHADGRLIPLRISGIRRVAHGDRQVLTALSVDITREESARQDLGAERRRFRYVFDDAPMGIVLLHLDPVKGARVLEANRRAVEIAGRGREQLVGSWFPPGSFTVLDPHSAREVPGMRPPAELPDGHGERALIEMRIDRPDGGLTVLKGSGIRTTPGELGRIDGWEVDAIFHYEDLTEQDRIDQEIKHLAEHDPLTGLLNRRMFGQAIVAQLGRADRRRRPGRGAMMLIDVDSFKAVNDRLGHLVGDAVLIGLAKVLRAELREGDVVARLGGDEFAILLPDAGLDRAESVAARICERLRGDPIHSPIKPATDVPVRVSVGVVGLDGLSEADDAYRLVDAAMYRAKQRGGDGFELAS